MQPIFVRVSSPHGVNRYVPQYNFLKTLQYFRHELRDKLVSIMNLAREQRRYGEKIRKLRKTRV